LRGSRVLAREQVFAGAGLRGSRLPGARRERGWRPGRKRPVEKGCWGQSEDALSRMALLTYCAHRSHYVHPLQRFQIPRPSQPDGLWGFRGLYDTQIPDRSRFGWTVGGLGVYKAANSPNADRTAPPGDLETAIVRHHRERTHRGAIPTERHGGGASACLRGGPFSIVEARAVSQPSAHFPSLSQRRVERVQVVPVIKCGAHREGRRQGKARRHCRTARRRPRLLSLSSPSPPPRVARRPVGIHRPVHANEPARARPRQQFTRSRISR
jgi:hypothetical protein